ncbi:MAG: hemerythrin domain-containing protein [Anaerolineales bacterium]|nr:hemerythrin domain-containing protein [Anaerolineales bacterium]
MKITDRLLIEHHLLRSLLTAMGQWLTSGMPAEVLRARAVLLGVALEDHVQREEQYLFDPLRPLAEIAQRPVDMMTLVHAEVRDLLEEIADPARDPVSRMWTVLQLTEEHFVDEENSLFPLAETLMDAATLERLGSEPEHTGAA